LTSNDIYSHIDSCSHTSRSRRKEVLLLPSSCTTLDRHASRPKRKTSTQEYLEKNKCGQWVSNIVGRRWKRQ